MYVGEDRRKTGRRRNSLVLVVRPWRLSSVLRRCFDIAVSAPAIVALSPLMLVIAILITLESPGPILFRQMCIGRDRRDRNRPGRSHGDRRGKVLYGRPFALLKFRTMYADSRERFPQLYRYTDAQAQEALRTIPMKVLVGNKDDPSAKKAVARSRQVRADTRVTRLGRILRNTSLDELPNLWNVLKGDMHLVGPRPANTDNIRYYTPEELEILRVRPGVTGLAQIKGRGLLTFRETLVYDLEYVKNRSLALDLKIFLKTITTLLKRDGAA